MDTSKVKRRTWSTSAVELFFEGLYQHGKDFPKILEHIQSKQRKSNLSIASGLTYNQVRFFYYRTWHKVELLLTDPSCIEKKNSKQLSIASDECGHHVESNVEGPSEDEVQLDSSLDEAEDPSKVLSPKKNFEENPEEIVQSREVDKATIESYVEQSGEVPVSDKTERRKDVVTVNGIQHSLDLVALICYWKLKKKHPAGDRSFARKLSELVYSGTTTIPGRLKGKRRTQLKIPVCGALRQISTGSSDKGALQNEMPEAVKDSASLGETIDESDTEGTGSTTIPVQLSIELMPITLSTWLHVQSKALNPRLRICISSSTVVEDLKNFLVGRFSVANIKIYSNRGIDFSKDLNPSADYSTGVEDSGVGIPDAKSSICSTHLLSDVYSKFGFSGVLKLSYEIIEDCMADKHQDLHNLFRLVRFFKPKIQDLQKPVVSSNTKVFSSPKVAEYLRSLPLLGARKSPISKYKKIRSQAAKRDIRLEEDSNNVIEVKEGRPAVVASNYLKTNIKKSKPKLPNNPRVGVRQLVPKPLTFLPESIQKKLEDSPARKALDFTLFDKLQPPIVNHSLLGTTFLQGTTVRIGPAQKLSLQPDPVPTTAITRASGQSLQAEPVQQTVHKPTMGSTGHPTSADQEVLKNDNIEEAVLSQYLLNSLEPTKDDHPQFSSSDTVNELLKGFAAPSPKESIHMLTLETEDVLPTFSQVLKQCSISEAQPLDETSSVEEKTPGKSKSTKESEMMDCTAVFDDSTTDYIRRFKELASSMEEGYQDP